MPHIKESTSSLLNLSCNYLRDALSLSQLKLNLSLRISRQLPNLTGGTLLHDLRSKYYLTRPSIVVTAHGFGDKLMK